MGTMATRRRETAGSSAARRAWPTARSTSTSPLRWRSASPRGRGRRRGAPSGARMTTAISFAGRAAAARRAERIRDREANAFQRELEAAQEDTRRREELRREAELRLRQRQAAPVDRVRSVDARLGGKGYAVAPASRDDGRGERLSGGSSAAQSAAATAAALGLLPVANGDGYGGRPRMQEAPPRRDLGRDELRPSPPRGRAPGGEVSRQAASDMPDVDIKAKMRNSLSAAAPSASARCRTRLRRSSNSSLEPPPSYASSSYADSSATAAPRRARRAAAARRRASRRGARAPRPRHRAPRRAPRPPRPPRRGTTATRGMASAATRRGATSGVAIAPPAAPSATREARGTRSVTRGARPFHPGAARAGRARPTLRRSRLNAAVRQRRWALCRRAAGRGERGDRPRERQGVLRERSARPVLLGAAARRPLGPITPAHPKGAWSTSGAPTACARRPGRQARAACGGRPGAAHADGGGVRGAQRGGAGELLAQKKAQAQRASRCVCVRPSVSAASRRARHRRRPRRAPSGCRASCRAARARRRQVGRCQRPQEPATQAAQRRARRPRRRARGGGGGGGGRRGRGGRRGGRAAAATNWGGAAPSAGALSTTRTTS